MKTKSLFKKYADDVKSRLCTEDISRLEEFVDAEEGCKIDFVPYQEEL